MTAPLFDAHPPLLAVDANGYVWRVYEAAWSMCPVNPDNEPIPEPVTYYAPVRTGKVGAPTCPTCDSETPAIRFEVGADTEYCGDNWHGSDGGRLR